MYAPWKQRRAKRAKDTSMKNDDHEVDEVVVQQVADAEPAITLVEKVDALTRCWNGGEDPEDVLTQIYARHGRQTPPGCAAVISTWDEVISRLLMDGDVEVHRLCAESGLVQ